LSPDNANTRPKLQLRQCADGIGADDTAMIEYLLELRRRFRIPLVGRQSLAANIGRVETTQE
jgi:hypothetical protein